MTTTKKALIITVASPTFLHEGELDGGFLSKLCKEIDYLLTQNIHIYLVGSPAVMLGILKRRLGVHNAISEVELIACAHIGHTVWQRELHNATMHLEINPMYMECTIDQFSNGVTSHVRNVCSALSKPKDKQFVCVSENTNASVTESRMFRDVTQYENFTEEFLTFLRSYYTKTFCLCVRESAVTDVNGKVIPFVTSPKLLKLGVRDKLTLSCNQKYPALDSIVKLTLRCSQLDIPCVVLGKDEIATLRSFGTKQCGGNYFSPAGKQYLSLL